LLKSNNEKLIFGLAMIFLGMLIGFVRVDTPVEAEEIVVETEAIKTEETDIYETVALEEPEVPLIIETKSDVVEIPYISDEELDLLAKCVMSEAGNQEELGKRLVIDVILNRMDAEVFAGQNTITQVIFAPGQFEVVSKGTIYKYTPTDDIYDLIREELIERTNNEVVFFRAGKFHSCGHAWKKVGDHYFSTM